MAITTVETVDIATELQKALATVDELRAYRYVADKFRPPGAVVALPEITYNDPDTPFCQATWIFPIQLVVARTNDQSAQDELSRLVSACVQALNAVEHDGIFSVEVLSARPTVTNVAGTDLPSYALRVQVRA